MVMFDKCPMCGGKVVDGEITKLLRGGGNSVEIVAPAEVCLDCGEALLSLETVLRFERIHKELAAGGRADAGISDVS